MSSISYLYRSLLFLHNAGCMTFLMVGASKVWRTLVFLENLEFAILSGVDGVLEVL